MGSGNSAVQSEDFISHLMLFSCDLELSVLSIPLFSVWVQGQEPRQNPFFSPSFIPLIELAEPFFVCFFFQKEKNNKSGKESPSPSNLSKEGVGLFLSSEVKCCYC